MKRWFMKAASGAVSLALLASPATQASETVGSVMGSVAVVDVAHAPGFSYCDWKLGVTRAFAHGYSVALGCYDTNAERKAYTDAYGHFVGRATCLLTVSKAFRDLRPPVTTDQRGDIDSWRRE